MIISKILIELFTILFEDNAPTKNTNTNKLMKLAPGILVPKIHLKTGCSMESKLVKANETTK